MKRFISIFVILLTCSFFLSISAVSSETYPSLQISFSEEIFTATPGNQGYITLEIRNGGSSTAEGIQIIGTTADYSIIRSEGEWTRSFGDLSGGSSLSALFHYKVDSSAPPGLYEMKFQIKSSNAGYYTQYALLKIEDSEIIDIKALSPTYLDIGKQTTMTLTLSNNGQVDVENILLSWEDEYTYILPVGTDNRIKVSSVKAGNTTDVSFDVIVSPSLPAGVYPLYFTLSFYDLAGSQQTISSQIGVQIGGATDFEVVLEETTGSSTTLAIANTGANTASSVIVKIPDQISYATTGSSSVNLGNLEAGDYTLSTFQLSQTSSSDNVTQPPFEGQDYNGQGFNMSQRPFENPNFNMSGRANLINRTNPGNTGIDSVLIVEIDYTDLFGIRQSVEKEVTMTATSTSSIGNTAFPFSRSSGQFSSQSEESFFDIDTGTMYIITGVLGIIVIVVIIKFNTIKTLPKKYKDRKGKKHENQ